MFPAPRISFPTVAARWLLALVAILGTTVTAFAAEYSFEGYQPALGGAIDLSDAVFSVALDGRDRSGKRVPSGVYLILLQVPGHTESVRVAHIE
jgi:hypothetical protein